MSRPIHDCGDAWGDGRGWNHRIEPVNGIDLHYVTAGDSDCRPVVLLHGFPECWWAWRRHIDAFAEEFRVIVPDMRGYNLSEKPFEVRGYRLDVLAGDIAALVDHDGHESAHVVGHDWGGVVAFETARRHPNTVDRLAVLNAPYPGAYDAQLTLKQLFRSSYVGFFQLPAVPERLLTANDYWLLERVFRDQPLVARAYTDEDIETYKRAWRRDGSIRAMLDYYRAFARENAGRLRDETTVDDRSVTAETLVLWGERDRALGPHVPNVIQRTVDSVTVEHYPDASHWLHAEFPERTTTDITEFLSD